MIKYSEKELYWFEYDKSVEITFVATEKINKTTLR